MDLVIIQVPVSGRLGNMHAGMSDMSAFSPEKRHKMPYQTRGMICVLKEVMKPKVMWEVRKWEMLVPIAWKERCKHLSVACLLVSLCLHAE